MRRFWPSQEKVRSTTHLLGNTRKPLGGISLRQSIVSPSLAHSSAQIRAVCSGTGLGGLRTTSTLRPRTCAAHLLPLPSYPASSQRCFKCESSVRADRSSNLSPSWSGTLALCTLALRTKPSVSTSRWRLRALTFLPPSYPLCSPPTPVVFADCESTMPALGCGFLPERTRKTWRRAAFSRSHVPSMRHFLNQS